MHPGGIDAQAAEGVRGLVEFRGQSRQVADVAAPLFYAHRLGTAEIGGGDLRRRGAQQVGNFLDIVIHVDGVIQVGALGVDIDGKTLLHHQHVEIHPAAVIAVGHAQACDGGRDAVLAGDKPADCLGRNFGDAVGREHGAVIIAQRVALLARFVTVVLVDPG